LSPVGNALARFGHSLACVKFVGAEPLRGRNMAFQISRLGGCDYTSRSLELLNQSLPDFFNAGGIAVENVLIRFRISSSVPEIFTVEV